MKYHSIYLSLSLGYYLIVIAVFFLYFFSHLSFSPFSSCQLSPKAVKDYNRPRAYLSTIASKNRVPIFSDIAEAALCCVYKLKGYKLHETHTGPRKSPFGTSV